MIRLSFKLTPQNLQLSISHLAQFGQLKQKPIDLLLIFFCGFNFFFRLMATPSFS